MMPGPAGGPYVMVSPIERDSVLALLDSSGKVQPGWPIALDGDCSLLATPAPDESIRVFCPGRIYSLAADGRPVADSTIELPDGLFGAGVVVDGVVHFLEAYSIGDEDATRLVTVGPDGAVERGAPWEMPDVVEESVQVGPDGTGYVLGYAYDEGDTEIIAFDLDGVRDGWPIRVKGQPDSLAFGPDGRIYATQGEEDREPSRFLVFGPDGRSLPIGSGKLPVAVTIAHSGAGPNGPPPPVVAEDGTTFVVTEDRGTTVYGLDATGRVMKGWPYRDSIGLQWSYCPPDTGGTCWRLDPVVGPDDVLYLLHPPRTAKVGGSIVAIGPDGHVRPGWPVELKRAGAHFRAVVVGPDGTAYALAVEPAGGDRSSATILAIAPDSTVRYSTTVVEP